MNLPSGFAAALATAVLLPISPALAAPTDLDGSFGSSGVTTTSIVNGPTELPSLIRHVVAQPDGKLLFVGARFRSNNWDWVIGRYSADGALDPGFKAGAGFESWPDAPQSLSFPDAGAAQPGGGALAVAVEPTTGLIDVSGQTTGSNAPITVLQLQSDGSLNTSYGGGGTAIRSIPISGSSTTTVHAAALQPDGKLVVAGEAFIFGNATPFVARFATDGTPDTSFATNGVYFIPGSACDGGGFIPDCSEGGLGLALSGSNVAAIYIGGYARGSIAGRVWKLVPGGGGLFTVDASYGDTANTPGGAQIERHAISEVDDLLLQGNSAVVTGYAQNGQNSQSCGIARVDPSGVQDTGFGAHVDVGGSCIARDFATDSAGRFVFTGETYSGTNMSGDLTLVAGRWTTAGQPDTAFAPGGGASLTPGGSPAFGESVLVQSDKPVIAGGAGSPVHDLMIARLVGGDLPAAPAGGGGTPSPSGGGNTPAFAPYNVHVPGIVGAKPPFKLGAQLACDPGTWGPSGAVTITGYRWYRSAFTASSAGKPKRVGGTQTYSVGPADQGTILSCAAIGTNAKGSNIATSPGAAVRQRIKIPASIRKLSVEKAKAYLRRLFDGQVSFGTDAEQQRAGTPKAAIPCDFGGTHDEGDGCQPNTEGTIRPHQVFNSTPAIGHFIDEAYGSGKLPKIVLDYYDPAQDKSDDVPRATPTVDCPASGSANVRRDFERQILGLFVEDARALLAAYHCPFKEITHFDESQSAGSHVTEVQDALYGDERGYRVIVSAAKHYDLVAVVFHKPKPDVDPHGGQLLRGLRPPGLGEDGRLTALPKGNVKNDLCFHVIEVATGRGVPGTKIRAFAPNGSEPVDTNGAKDELTTDSDGDKCGSFSIHETGVYRFTMTYNGSNGSTEEGVLPLTAVDRGTTKTWNTISGREMRCTVVDCAQLGFASSRRAHAANVFQDIGNFFRGILDRLTGHGSPIVNAANAAQAAQSDGGTGPTLYYAQTNNGVTPAVLADRRGVKIISNDGASIISDNGGGIISNDGASLITENGAGVRVKVNGIISNDGGSLVALSQGGGVKPAIGGGTTVVAVKDGRIISNDGGSLLGDAGAAIISDNGGGLVGNSGGTFISDAGSGLVAPPGGAVVMFNGQNVIAGANGVIPKGTLINNGGSTALPLSGFISDQGGG